MIYQQLLAPERKLLHQRVGEAMEHFYASDLTPFLSQGSGYDLIAFFDCFHDLGTPIEVATHTSVTLAKEGTVLLVEPMAGEHIEDNLNPVGRLYGQS